MLHYIIFFEYVTVKNIAKQAAFHSGFVRIKARAARRNNVSLSERNKHRVENLKGRRKQERKSCSGADSLTMTVVHRLSTAADLNASELEKPDTGGNAPLLAKPHPEHRSSVRDAAPCSRMVMVGTAPAFLQRDYYLHHYNDW